MIKKTWLLTAGLLLSSPTIALAQSAVGDWYQYPVFSNSVEKVIETSNKVYYLSNGYLFSFSPEDNSSYSYNSNNKLSDNTISDIYYNYDKKFLVVAYETGNIDILKDDGIVKNLPEIKDALITTRKTINGIDFKDNLMAVATMFGVVIYDTNKWEVKESGNYNKQIERVCFVGDDLVLYYDFTFHASPISARHNTLDKFIKLKSLNNYAVSKLDNNEVVVLSKNKAQSTGNYAIYIFSHNDTEHTWTLLKEIYDIKTGENPMLQHFKDGVFVQSGKDVTIIRGSEDIQKITLPDTMEADNISFYNDQDKVWSGGAAGVGRFDISSATPTALYNYMIPNGSTCKVVTFLAPSADNSRLYLCNLGPTLYKSQGNGDGYWIPQTASVLKNGEFTDASCYDPEILRSEVKKNQKEQNTTKIMGPSGIVVNPFDPDMYFVSTVMEGAYAVKNNHQVKHFVGDPMYAAWGYMAYDINVDPQNNLWVGLLSSAATSPYYILPADKYRNDVSAVQMSDFIPHSGMIGKYKGQKDMFSVFCKKSTMAVFGCGKYGGDMVIIDTKGTYADPSDDVVTVFEEYIDQDGKTFLPARYVCGVEDQRGRVWIGTTSGVFELTDPTKYTTPSMPIKRLKVPRNDGTVYADYLLDSDQVNCISVDPANRKWIATEGSGVYLVSEDGDKILEHYTTENSALPSNTVYSVYCDPDGNKVYFGTPFGLMSFNSKAGPAQSDFSNVLAYPNPVRPDYTGWITISGLMDNSLVKIADAAGQVLFTTRSEGGMAMWDGCNSAGERVKSGVYYVLASQGDDTHSEGIVTKILVIN